MRALPAFPLRAVHLTALWAFAVSQPVFSLLHGNPEFLVVRGSTRLEVLVFASLLTFAPPLVAVVCEWLVSLASRAASDILHLVILGAFVVPLALHGLKRLDPDAPSAVLLASTVALVVVAAYERWDAVRSFFTLSASLSIIGLVLFVVGVPLAKDDLAGAEVAAAYESPVVVVVLDELPISSLTTNTGAIDAVRYPNFARLARDATWYRRATTVHDSSTGAVPAILTGRLPKNGALPTLTHHPANLFTLLGESYRLSVQETVTYLCPQRYCPRRREPLLSRLGGLFGDVRIGFLHRVLPRSLAGGLPQIGDRWGGFSRERILVARDSAAIFRILDEGALSPRRQFDRFLAGLSTTQPAGTLHFAHLMLPHSPWRFLPSGRTYGHALTDGLEPDNSWTEDAWLVEQGFQRHLLQVGYTDLLLGQLLRRLERSGLYDRALVVVLADHGVSFTAGGNSRLVSRVNVADIAHVPLFVKLPRQREGRIDSRSARTIDVLPTIADVLGVRLPWAVDGHSLLRAPVFATHVSVGRSDGAPVRASVSEVERGMKATVRRKSALFGQGRDSLYEIGPNRALLGLELRHVQVSTAIRSSVHFEGSALFADVRTSSVFVPARITGTIEGARLPPGLALAVAVNGRVAATTRCFRVDGKLRFSALVPEAVFREGFNRVELFAVEGPRSKPLLIKLGQTGSEME